MNKGDEQELVYGTYLLNYRNVFVRERLSETPTLDTGLLQFLVLSGVDHDVTRVRFRDEPWEKVRQEVAAQYRERRAQMRNGMKAVETRISVLAHNMYQYNGAKSVGDLRDRLNGSLEHRLPENIGTKSMRHLNQILEHYHLPIVLWVQNPKYPRWMEGWMEKARHGLDPYLPLNLSFAADVTSTRQYRGHGVSR